MPKVRFELTTSLREATLLPLNYSDKSPVSAVGLLPRYYPSHLLWLGTDETMLAWLVITQERGTGNERKVTFIVPLSSSIIIISDF